MLISAYLLEAAKQIEALMLMQGFNRVTAVSLLISGQALLEIAGSVLVFKAGLELHGSYLLSMGLVTLFSAFIAACVGILAARGRAMQCTLPAAILTGFQPTVMLICQYCTTLSA